MQSNVVRFTSEDFEEAEAPKPLVEEDAGRCWDHEILKKNIEVPKSVNLVKADASIIETTERFSREPLVEMFFAPNDEMDSVIWTKDEYGKDRAVRVSETVSINGVQFILYPGKNMVPKTVYEFLMTVEDMRRKISMGPPPPRMIQDMRR